MACFVRYAFNFDNDSLILSNYLFFCSASNSSIKPKVGRRVFRNRSNTGRELSNTDPLPDPREIMEILRNDL